MRIFGECHASLDSISIYEIRNESVVSTFHYLQDVDECQRQRTREMGKRAFEFQLFVNKYVSRNVVGGGRIATDLIN